MREFDLTQPTEAEKLAATRSLTEAVEDMSAILIGLVISGGIQVKK